MTTEQCQIIEQYYFAFHTDLLKYALASLRNISQAEEAVQDTFRIASEKPEDLSSSSNPKGWLLNILKNVIRNMRSISAAHHRLTAKLGVLRKEDTLDIDDLLSIETLWQDIAATKEYQFLKLFVFDGLSYLEVAEMYHITVNACRVRKMRAAAALREKILKKYDF